MTRQSETPAALLARLSKPGQLYEALGMQVTLALLSQPRWITRTVENIRFVDRNVVRRRISRHFVVPKERDCQPLLIDDRGKPTGLCVLPVYAVEKGQFITCDLTDASGTSVSLAPLPDRWKLCYLSLLSTVKAAGLKPDAVLQKRMWDIVSKPSPTSLDGLSTYLTGVKGGQKFLSSELFGLASFFARNYVIFRAVDATSREHVLTMRLDRRVPDRRSDLEDADRRPPKVWLATRRWLGLSPHEFRHEFVQTAGSTHLEVEASDGIAIGGRTLELPVAVSDGGGGRIRARMRGAGTSKRRARFLVPRTTVPGKCVATMDFRPGAGVMREGGPAVAFLFTVLAAVIAFKQPAIANNDQAGTAAAVLLLLPSLVAIVAARPAEHPRVSRVVVGPRLLTVSVILLAALTALALIVGWHRSVLFLTASAGLCLTVLLSWSAVAARRGTRVGLRDEVAGLTMPEPHGLPSLTRIG